MRIHLIHIYTYEQTCIHTQTDLKGENSYGRWERHNGGNLAGNNDHFDVVSVRDELKKAREEISELQVCMCVCVCVCMCMCICKCVCMCVYVYHFDVYVSF